MIQREAFVPRDPAEWRGRRQSLMKYEAGSIPKKSVAKETLDEQQKHSRGPKGNVKRVK